MHRTWLLNLCAVLGASLLALAGCEVLLGVVPALKRWTDRSRPPRALATRRPDLYESDALLGYRLRPSRIAFYSYPQEHPRRLEVTSNRGGFRGRHEFFEPDSRTGIVVLGDSMVFGEGVEESERFTDLLQAMEPGWRIDNLGMTGFGPDLMLRSLERVGLELRPKVVVLCLYTDDFRRVHPYYAGVGFPIPRFRLESGRLVSVPYPTPSWWDRLRIVSLVRELIWRRSGAELRLNRAILDRFLDLSTNHGFRPCIVFFPGREDLPGDQRRRAWLRHYCAGNRVPFRDLTDSILKAGAPDFIEGNWHWNPKGHALVAAQLRPFLAGVIDGPTTPGTAPATVAHSRLGRR